MLESLETNISLYRGLQNPEQYIANISSLIDVYPNITGDVFNRIINIVDTFAQKMKFNGTNATFINSSLALAVKGVNGSDFGDTSFTVFNASSLQVDGGPTAGLTPQGSISLPASLLKNLTDEQKKLVERVIFFFYQNSTHFQGSVQSDSSLISGILGCSVFNTSISNLSESVVITLQNSASLQDNYTCAFWDSDSKNWNTSGCSTNSTSQNETVCTCNHLTIFALLRNIKLSTDLSQYTTQNLLSQTSNLIDLYNVKLSELENLLSGPNINLTLGTTVINTVSNLLDASPEILASSSNRIIRLVDAVGLKLVLEGQNETIRSTSVALAVKRLDMVPFTQTTFSITDSNLQIDGPQLLSPQGSILLPASLTQNLTAQQQQMASRVQFSFYQKSTLFQDKSLNPNRSMLISEVLSASVANLSISHLTDNIIITLRNINSYMSNTQNNTLSCVFWDFDLNGGSGGWSSEGCSVLNSTDKETVCSCNHLTGFGVLMSISDVSDSLQNTVLTFISYIGCSLSVCSLCITLITYLGFEKLRKDIPSKILIHLCLALLMLNLVFLLDSWLSLYTNAVGLCISTAFFLHYFLLASLTWMALQAVYMYLTIVKVFNSYFHNFMIKIGIVGWGIPLVVVIIVLSINETNYTRIGNTSQNYFCWMEKSVTFYVTTMAYLCVVFLLTFGMFVVVMVLISRIKRRSPHDALNRARLHKLCSVISLAVLLGLTWGFAFFTWEPINLTFIYLFTICNSLHGFLFFVFHCAAKHNVRRQWRVFLFSGKFRKFSERTQAVFSRVTISIAASLAQMSYSFSKNITVNKHPEKTLNKDSSLNVGNSDEHHGEPSRL
ncbi:adhesion G-protein coupled receptor G2-like [Brachyhypopomus gauderio]|uniref:adhesion G-protein coupled receptor G2-like n=1 Tax=Brachyhypopomus gauderio TaxID=698409 RepID=UPI004042F1E1